ncbi:hypothetical protein CR513_23047, partial [Mucuna pruriens]
WINNVCKSDEYENRVKELIEFAKINLLDSNKSLYCPCGALIHKVGSCVKIDQNLKARNRRNDKSFIELLELLKDMLLKSNTFSNYNYKTKNILCLMGMKYKKIHACLNDYIFYGERV